jgi:hypothetical protein
MMSTRWTIVLAALATALATWAFGVPGPSEEWRLFAATRLDARGLDVEGGAVGANERITATRPLVAPQSAIASDEVVLDPASRCLALFANRGQAAAGCGPAAAVATPIVRDVPVTCLPASPAAPCDPSRPIVVGHGEERRLPSGVYGAVSIAGGGAGPGRLILEGGDYRFCAVRLGRNARMLARGPADVHVDGDAWIDNGSHVGMLDAPEASCAIRLRIDGRRLRISRRAVVSGRLCAPAARAELRVGARLHGTLYAYAIATDRIHAGPCVDGPTTTTTTGSIATTSSTTTSRPATTSMTGPPPTATTTTARASTSTTATAPSSTTSSSTTTSTTTPTTSCPIPPAVMDFTTRRAGGSCGETLRTIGGTVLKELICGNLSLGGGASTVTDALIPEGAQNRFALACAGAACAVAASANAPAGVDCSDVGCRFGTPLAIANAGTSTCVENTFAVPASGTVDLGEGSVTLDVRLTSRAVLTGNHAQPCPICRQGSLAGPPCAGSPSAPCAGVCEGSANQGSPCTSLAASGLSRDCAGPASSGSGNVCYKGPTPGKRCATGTDCGGGTCAAWLGDLPISLSPLTTESVERSADSSGRFCPGQGTNQEGAFRSGLCAGGTADGAACAGFADCPGGTCRVGKICDGGAADRKPCASSTDCPAPGRCVAAGALARVIRMRGMRMTSGCALDTSRDVKLVSVFCVPLTASTLVNSATNLPGPGATSLPGTIVLRR